jgi:pimeloyl-ACP methyl ester carboxylesterase
VRSTLSPDQLRRSWYIGFFQIPYLAELAGRRGLLQRGLRGSGMTKDDVADFEAGMLADGALPGGLGWYRALPFSLSLTGGMWNERVSVPVTHVWSDQDDALGRRTAELAHRWVTGEYELRVLEGRCHWLPEHAPDELADIVLERVGSAEAHQSS